jgi:hypothetical protein
MIRISIFFVILLATSFVRAETTVSETATEVGSSESRELQGRFLFFIGTGISKPQHDSKQQNLISSVEDKGGVHRFAGSFDFPAIYYRLPKNYLLGPVLNVTFEETSKDYLNRDSIQFNTYNISLSGMRFFSDEVGNGFFIRADLGHSHQVQNFKRNSLRAQSQSFNGLATQIGLGYGFNFFQKTRFLASLNYFYNDLSSHHSSGAALYLGILL